MCFTEALLCVYKWGPWPYYIHVFKRIPDQVSFTPAEAPTYNLFGCFWPVSFSLHTVTDKIHDTFRLPSLTFRLDFWRGFFCEQVSLVSEVEMWLLFWIVLSYQGFTGVVVQSTCWRLGVCVTLDLASFSWFSWHGYFHSSQEPRVPSIHVLN